MLKMRLKLGAMSRNNYEFWKTLTSDKYWSKQCKEDEWMKVTWFKINSYDYLDLNLFF